MKPPLINDPALYRKLSEPFPSKEAALAACEAFDTELRTLREKHRMLDVVCIVNVPAIDPDALSGETLLTSLTLCGDPSHAPGMLAAVLKSAVLKSGEPQ